MSYKDFEFDVNPSGIKFQYSKNISAQPMIDFFDKTQEISVQPVVVTGNGAFVGNDRNEKMQELKRVFNHKGSGYLFCPGFQPVKAFFESLIFQNNAQKNAIDYTFTFAEDSQGKQVEYDFGYTFAKSNENLFDIANRLDVDVEILVTKNDFKDAFAVKEGDKVYYA